jgi:hypothetical protein
MRKLLALIGAILAGGIAISLSSLSQQAHASFSMN